MATKTFEELKQLAIQIRDEKTNKQNTATRVGTAMLEHINKLEQDYYDKTQTDEELKERDDKLTELVGEYTSDKSFLKVITDEKGNFLFGITKDGSIEWTKGVPSAIKKELESYIKKEYISNNAFLHVFNDKNGNFLLGILQDGSIEWTKGVPSAIKKELENYIKTEIISTPSFLRVITDLQGKFLFGITKNGEVEWAKGTPSAIKKELDSINKKISDERHRPDAYLFLDNLSPIDYHVSAVLIHDGYLLVGDTEGYIHKYRLNDMTEIGKSQKITYPQIKSLSINDGYVYAITRWNGSGMTDTNYSLKNGGFLATFEANSTNMSINADNFDSYNYSGNAAITEDGEPSPSRGQHSAKLLSSGVGKAILKKAISFNGVGYINLWVKCVSSDGTTNIPLLFNGDEYVLSLVVNANKTLSVKVGENTYPTTLTLNDWYNIKIAISDSNIQLSGRDKNANSVYTQYLSDTPISTISANNVGIGIDATSAAEILIDDLDYCPIDIDKVSFLNGSVVTLDFESLTIQKTYLLNIRGLSSLINDNKLYVGCIGGLNVYDISNSDTPNLLAWYRYSTREWPYPPTGTSIYADEYQGISIMENDNIKYLVGTRDVQGVSILNVSDYRNIYLVKDCNDIPFVPAIRVSDNQETQARQYHEWGCIADYPYIYTAMGTMHSFFGLSTGTNYIVDNKYIISGIKVRDISDINNIKVLEVKLPEDVKANVIKGEWDGCPNYLTMYNGKIYEGTVNSGVSAFTANGLKSQYIRSFNLGFGTRQEIVTSDNIGNLIACDKKNTNIENNNIYLLKIGL
jgi:hypothetical protein|uniref:Uncharacterized protein n=1 Tax=Siphoviridae sp. ctH8e11 TaxID=2827567 RepID=A0A8S5LSD1_9CAUD|nr:MAG TPA: hypothetical protein [Siphoviridae sp. ctH8e11]